MPSEYRTPEEIADWHKAIDRMTGKDRHDIPHRCCGKELIEAGGIDYPCDCWCHRKRSDLLIKILQLEGELELAINQRDHYRRDLEATVNPNSYKERAR